MSNKNTIRRMRNIIKGTHWRGSDFFGEWWHQPESINFPSYPSNREHQGRPKKNRRKIYLDAIRERKARVSRFNKVVQSSFGRVKEAFDKLGKAASSAAEAMAKVTEVGSHFGIDYATKGKDEKVIVIHSSSMSVAQAIMYAAAVMPPYIYTQTDDIGSK